MADHWTYGTALREARTRKGLSQDEAARLVGVKLGAWGAWERGGATPGLERLSKIVEALGIPPETIGYEQPGGWELVPAEWIQDRFHEQETSLARIENLQTQLLALVQALR